MKTAERDENDENDEDESIEYEGSNYYQIKVYEEQSETTEEEIEKVQKKNIYYEKKLNSIMRLTDDDG